MVNIGSLVGDVGSRLVVNIQGHLLGLRHNNWLSGRCSRRWIPAQGADPPWYRPRDRCCPATRRHAAACHFATPARPRLQHVTRHPRGLYLSVAASAARARGLSPTCRAISASCACSVSRARMCVCVRARARVYVCGWVCVCRRRYSGSHQAATHGAPQLPQFRAARQPAESSPAGSGVTPPWSAPDLKSTVTTFSTRLTSQNQCESLFCEWWGVSK